MRSKEFQKHAAIKSVTDIDRAKPEVHMNLQVKIKVKKHRSNIFILTFFSVLLSPKKLSFLEIAYLKRISCN